MSEITIPKTNGDDQQAAVPEIDLSNAMPEEEAGEGANAKPRPLYRMPGAKWGLMPKLVKLLPAHTHFVSVFGGTGAEILRKRPSEVETFNDRDEHIYNLFKVIKDAELCSQLREQIQIPHCRDLYNDAIEVLKHPISDRVVSATAFLIVAHQGRITSHPSLKRPTGWRVHPREIDLRPWLNLPETLDFVQRRFLSVQIENRHCLSVLQKLDSPDTCFLLDPPYHPDTLGSSNDFYRITMTPGEHRAMLAAVKWVAGRVVVCGYDHEVYCKALGDWPHREFDTVTTVDNQGTRAKRKEMVWMNYDPATTTLWAP